MRLFNNEITISVLFLLILLAFLDPVMIFMPSPALYMAMAGMVILFAFFAGLVWRERARDERDELHKMLAGRIGYLLGAVTLLVGILVESAAGHVDPWLVYGLGAMVVGKLVGLFWSRRYR
ncbi:MAG TPA: hypothetical protein VJG64_02030 [Candidatus Paceibacterota bacterium]